MLEHDRNSYASLSRRLEAFLLDTAIVLISSLAPAILALRLLLSVGVFLPAGLQAGASPEELWKSYGFMTKLNFVAAFIISAGGAFYYALCHASLWQATFGKRLLNIYVSGDDGRRISTVRSFGRWIAVYVLGQLGLGLISIITIVYTREKKGLHDFVAKTVVLNGKPTSEGSLQWWRITAFLAIPFAWLVLTFLATM